MGAPFIVFGRGIDDDRWSDRGVAAVVEMWVHNAFEHGVFVVTVGFVAGAGLYGLLQVRVQGCLRGSV